MKTIKIKSLTLLNFKGIRNQTYNFGQTTIVSGRNGLGKTTIVDAFLWLFFNKNAAGSTIFGIKTYDENGNIIPRLPHEVSAVITVDDTEVTLRKSLTEKWVKPRGKTTEEFQGNETSYEVNNVPYKAKDYAIYIERILPEGAFRAVTNPNFFTSLPWQDQKSLLITLVGGVSQDEIINGDQTFARLISEITGKDIELYRREIVTTKNKLKADADTISPRIEENMRNLPESPNKEAQQAELKTLADAVAANEAKISELKQAVETIDLSLSDSAKRIETENAAVRKLIENKSTLENNLSALTAKISDEATTEYTRLVSLRNIAIATRQTTEKEIRNIEYNIENLRAQREQQEQIRVNLRSVIDSINAEKYTPDSTTCPTCGQPLPDEMLAEAESKFNDSKAERIKKITADGIKAKNTSEQMAQQIAEQSAKLEEVRKQLKPIPGEPATPTVDYESDLRFIAIKNEIAALDHQIASQKPADNSDNTKLVDTKQNLANEIEKLQAQNATLNSKIYSINAENKSFNETTARLNQRIAELTNQLHGINQRIAELEQMEDLVIAYKQREVAILETKINNKFQICRWRFYKPLVNGGQEETCECVLNGVPFQDANRALQINAGIDIINTLQCFYNFAAPIFIDNAEAVNSLHPTLAQTIALHVTTDNELTIKTI